MTEILLIPYGDAFRIAWDEWIAYRKERRLAKYTPISYKKALNNIIKISNNDEQTACLIIEQSISNNWQGLFPLKNIYNGTSNDTGRTSAISKW